MLKIFRNKKGNWVDIFEFMGEAIAIGILIFFVAIFLTQFSDGMQSNSQLNESTVALERAETAKNSFPTASDFILPLIYMFVLGFTAWSARRVQSSHMFTFVGVIVLVILMMVSFQVENVWNEFITNATVLGQVTNFPITNFMLNNFRYFILGAGLIVGVSLYGKDE